MIRTAIDILIGLGLLVDISSGAVISVVWNSTQERYLQTTADNHGNHSGLGNGNPLP
jgi:hypothetical protein